jgi:hypothetical protein
MQLKALLLKTLKHKTQWLEVLLQGAAVDTKVVEVNGSDVVYKSRRKSFIIH